VLSGSNKTGPSNQSVTGPVMLGELRVDAEKVDGKLISASAAAVEDKKSEIENATSGETTR
jgi:hypothetical protein